MEIEITIEGLTAIAKTNINGLELEWGYKRTGNGEWEECIGIFPDDETYKDELYREQIDALIGIPLVYLQDAFGDDYFEDDD